MLLIYVSNYFLFAKLVYHLWINMYVVRCGEVTSQPLSTFPDLNLALLAIVNWAVFFVKLSIIKKHYYNLICDYKSLFL